MESEERYEIKCWCVNREVPGGIPKEGFKKGGILSVKHVPGSRARGLTWPDEVGAVCSIKELPFDVRSPVVLVQFGNLKSIECSVDLSFDDDGLLHGRLKFAKLGSNDGNTGTFMAEACPPPPPVEPG